MEEDINIIRKYLAGNNKAIEELVLKYQKYIYTFSYRMTTKLEEAKKRRFKRFGDNGPGGPPFLSGRP
ncbi:hypothetical protein BMS3Abin07_02068 [bacterium BMS3Abin07]|nr:hypothetical protein BMS3Abin07_02068 [bacterium BMS3Abin07]GBE32591.1 hypothetical protein BMS3Bbin05_01507 [bacterium BMS3Bbin05]HDO21377.1 hypothetical protein [Nitrospirota bacterium]HDO21786.1 hypothetical protein [Nitrospirota bacterium]HDZ87252.1 hypothetical protein [Nitrospirota bacterium]